MQPAKRLTSLAAMVVASLIAFSACGEKAPAAKTAAVPAPPPASVATPVPAEPPAPAAPQPPLQVAQSPTPLAPPLPPPSAPMAASIPPPPAPMAAPVPPPPSPVPAMASPPTAAAPIDPLAATQLAQNTAAQPAATSALAASGLGTSDYEVPGVEVTLLELKRTSGDTVTARWRYRNTDKDNKVLTKATGWTDSWRLAWDSYLIDGTNKKKYLILKDAEGKPIAASHGSGSIKLAGGQTLNTWAKYPAPPENVQKVSLYLPGVAPFEDVPIAK